MLSMCQEQVWYIISIHCWSCWVGSVASCWPFTKPPDMRSGVSSNSISVPRGFNSYSRLQKSMKWNSKVFFYILCLVEDSYPLVLRHSIKDTIFLFKYFILLSLWNVLNFCFNNLSCQYTIDDYNDFCHHYLTPFFWLKKIY